MRSQTHPTILITVLLLLLTTTLSFADGIIILPPQFPRLSIKYHHVDVRIENQVATTRVDQVFVNPSPRRMEGEYIFPLPGDVSISEFAMYVEGERLTAELLDSQQARAIYEEIVRNQRDPALLEYIGTNMFRARVFPIEPYSDKRIELEYTEVLRSDAGLTQYRYPLNTEKFSARPLESVTVNVDLRSNIPIKTIYSPSHPITVERDGEFAARVVYTDENIKPDTDFLLYYSVSPDVFGVNLLTYRQSGEDGFYLLMLTPTTQPSTSAVLNKNIVFVLDTSGSMRGEKIEQAKGALRFSINGLRETDYFNIVDFSTDVRTFSKQPLPANAENVGAAMRYIDRIEAVGGTNINDALLTGLLEAVDGVINLVVFLTDGIPTIGVTVLEQILDNVRGANHDGKRVFIFGVGDDVNTKLLDQLAIDHRGITEYVRPSEDIEVKVSSFFTKISQPVLSNPSVEFSTVEAREAYPRQIPDLFAGLQLIQFGRYTTSGVTSICLRGEVNSEVLESDYEATFPEANSKNEFIPRLWATRKIGYLLEEIKLHGDSQELVDEIVRLSKRYGVITPYTSFLILEDDPALVTNPLELGPVVNPLSVIAFDVGPEAVTASVQIGGLRDAVDTSTTMPQQTNVVKVVGAKTFFLRDGVWRESSFTEGTPTIDVQYAGESYFELLRIHPELGRYFAIGKQVIVEYQGVFYRVVETLVQSPMREFDLSIPQGISLIHLPLAVTYVNDQSMEIQTVGDLYDALGKDHVRFIITYQPPFGLWRSFLGDTSRGTAADRRITDEMGFITVMKNPVTLRLKGNALGALGMSQIHLTPGTNLVGVPLKDERVKSVSDLLTLLRQECKDNAQAIIVHDPNGGTFRVVARPGDPSDIPLTGGQGFIIIAREACVAEIRGEAWDNVSGRPATAPPVTLVSHPVDGSTPVLAVHGAVVDEVTGVAKAGFRVTVKNLSTGTSLGTRSSSDFPFGSYGLTFVDAVSNHAARVGDILEITVQTPSPLIGVKPLRHIVSPDDVRRSQIHLPNLIAYRIPAKTQLLSNYPNPFNPETWMPYQLSFDTGVQVIIYDLRGALVRRLDLGHQRAGYYHNPNKAAYWDGRNTTGELVSSGIYFYQLRAGDYSEVRRMVILK